MAVNGCVNHEYQLRGTIYGIRGPKGDKGDPGASDYNALTSKPQINGVTLEGNKTLEDIGIDTSKVPKVEFKTTEDWESQIGYIPREGELIIYTDYSYVEREIGGEVVYVNVPNFKIGDGLAFVQDLPFISEDLRKELDDHLNDVNAHVTLAEKLMWNNKLSVDDDHEVIEGALTLGRY